MKITTNFTFPFDAQLVWVAGLLWLLAAAGLFTALSLVADAARLRTEQPRLSATWQRLQQTPLPTPSGPSMPSAQMEDIRQRLKSLNALDAGGGRSVSSILARLEKWMPPGTRLLSFQQDSTLGTIHLVVESAQMAELSAFLEALEKDGSFSSVNLTKQTQGQAARGSAPKTQFFLELTDGLS